MLKKQGKNPKYKFRHQHKISRKYRIKDDNFIRYCVSNLNSVSHEDLQFRLDEYERGCIQSKAKWVREAPLEEIIVIMTKLGFPMCLSAYSAHVHDAKRLNMKRWRNSYLKTKDVNMLLEDISLHKFFAISGRDWIKTHGLFSQILNGVLYVPNKDYKAFLKNGINAEVREEVKNIDIAFGTAFLLNGIDEVDDTDLAILYLCKRYDDLPLASNYIYDVLEYKRDHQVIQRHIAKLTKGKYLYRHGNTKNSTYSLADRGMNTLNKARKAFFQNCQFWNKKPINQIINNGINKRESTSTVAEN